jgi:hypothetical protein
MLEQLEWSPKLLNIACRHLDEYLETSIRLKESKP